MTRLIDADELKKKFNERSYWTYTQEYGDAIPIGWIMSGIDNAPTADDWQKYSDELWKNAYEKGKADRQQGKWIMLNEHTKNPQLWYKCNLCGAYYSPTNFCPNCGAKMSS